MSEAILAAVSQAAAAVVQEAELERTLERIIAGVRDHLPLDRAGVFLYEREHQQIRRLIGIDADGAVDLRPSSPIPIGDGGGPIQQVVLGRIPYLHRGDPGERLPAEVGLARGSHDQRVATHDQRAAHAIVPLLAHGEILGALSVDNLFSGEPIPASLVAPLCLFGHVSAAAINQALKGRRLQQIHLKLGRLAEACGGMAGFLDSEALFYALLPAMREVLNADGYSAWHRQPAGRWRCVAQTGIAEHQLGRLNALFEDGDGNGAGILARLFPSGRVLIAREGEVSDVGEEAQAALLTDDARGLIGVPVRQAGELFGALLFCYADPAAMEPEAIELARLFAGYAAAVALTSALKQHELLQTEAHKKQFYRDIVYAVTNGKLILCEPEEIEQHWGRTVAEQVVARDYDLRALRGLIQEVAVQAGMLEGRVEDLSLCASEAATNALKHAGGGRVWLDSSDGAIRVRIADAGGGIDPLELPRATLMKGYSTRASMGLGFTLMHELADCIYLHTGPHGTTVILEMALQPRTEAEKMLELLKLVD